MPIRTWRFKSKDRKIFISEGGCSIIYKNNFSLTLPHDVFNKITDKSTNFEDKIIKELKKAIIDFDKQFFKNKS
jgi:hypothetical protein